MNTQHQTDETVYTPSKVSESNITLYIPIYQRLFVWDDKQINQLLEDLYWAWFLCKEVPKPYYIGAITIRAVDGEKWEVVDGQQRLTFLMLFGCCALKDGLSADAVPWKNLVFTDVTSKVHRIHYMGRKKDQDCLYGILSDYSSKELDNPHMACFCRCWHAFTHGEVDNNGKKEKRFNEANLKEFSRYVFNQTSFLVSLLPEYSPHQLNCIFEKMNSSGRQLEQDEIIKGLFFAKEACEWNSALNIQVDDNKAELGGGSEDKLTFSGILSTAWSGLGLQEPAVSKSGEVKLQETETRQLLLSKPVMLLHVLELTGASFALEGMDWSRIAKRDARRLVETFKEVFLKLTDGKIDKAFKSMFIGTLTRYREWMNKNIIFKREDDRLDFLDTREMLSDDDTKQIPETQALRQFQSMLYVSSGEEQEWILDAYRECAGNVSKSLSLDLLKQQDNKRRYKTLVELVYRHIDRYWFWRLDYYLWENRKEMFKDDKSLKVANQYVFRRNRSIEHIAPQNPKRDSKITVLAPLLDSFGNLAMISSGQNSSLQNESFEVKRAYVEAFRNGSKSGTVESLKLLKIYEYPEWSEDSVKDHGKAMIDVLIASFPEEVFAGIHAQLEQAKNLFEASPTSP
jgi:hypothetical protein